MKWLLLFFLSLPAIAATVTAKATLTVVPSFTTPASRQLAHDVPMYPNHQVVIQHDEFGLYIVYIIP